jgi:hypothetical protein
VTDNLALQTGRTLEEWYPVLDATGLEKHSELMAVLKQEHGVSHGFANMIVLGYRSRGVSQEADDLVDAQYAGAKAAMRPIHDRLVEVVRGFGADVEIAPKKTSVALRRKLLFAMVEPSSAKRVQLGIQLKGEPATERLLAWGSMCSHRVNLGSVDDIDAELIGWLRAAYDRAG